MGKKTKHVVEESAGEVMETEAASESTNEKASYEELLNHVSVIAKPMASRKLTKKIYKLLKKGKLTLDFFNLLI